MNEPRQRVVLAISGASGAIYALRLLETLVAAGRDVYLTISTSGAAVFEQELGLRLDLESLQLARDQGYSGVALKACKGHTEALLMGAAAQKYGMFLCVQDLSCPGYSFLHSASIAARIPTIAAIEGNSRQYCPAGNRTWAG